MLLITINGNSKESQREHSHSLESRSLSTKENHTPMLLTLELMELTQNSSNTFQQTQLITRHSSQILAAPQQMMPYAIVMVMELIAVDLLLQKLLDTTNTPLYML
jgi:hypothetical protein